MSEKILTLHPEGKQGVNISRDKYDRVSTAIIEALITRGELTFGDLIQEMNRKLAGTFDGSISWYTTTVKMDLEARGAVERVPGSAPQLLRLVSK